MLVMQIVVYRKKGVKIGGQGEEPKQLRLLAKIEVRERELLGETPVGHAAYPHPRGRGPQQLYGLFDGVKHRRRQLDVAQGEVELNRGGCTFNWSRRRLEVVVYRQSDKADLHRWHST